MGRAGKSLLRSSGLRAAADDLGRGQKLRAAAGQRAALAGALAENLLTRRRNQCRVFTIKGATMLKKVVLAGGLIAVSSIAPAQQKEGPHESKWGTRKKATK